MASSLRLLALFALASCLLALPGTAQIRGPGKPASLRHPLPADIPLVLLPAPDVRALRAEDEARGNRPLRYGAQIDTVIGLEDAGRWDEVSATGELVWRVELASPGAHSLGLFFQEFDLPAGAQLFLYGEARTEVLGAYGEHNENDARTLAVQPLRGDRVVIEYVEPPGVGERPRLVLGQVVHDYLDILAKVGMDSGGIVAVSCLVDVNCPAAANHQDVKRAVVWLFGGGGGCSGSILNNTAEDGTPYLLTAQHCGNMTNAVIVFDYERTGCGSGGSSQSKTLSGATLLAASIPYDGQLYRLNQTPPASYEPFYAGWSVETNIGPPVVGISHPSGDPKKIQIENHDPLLTSNRWNVGFDVGIVQPGSSGSPLFNAEKRVIGPLSTGTGNCSQNLAGYGRFDLFYSSRDLAQWLDPMAWGLEGIDGYDSFSAYSTTYNGDGVNPELYSTVTPPRLGTTWTSVIDATGHPAAGASVILIYSAPNYGPVLSFGQLLLDLGATRYFRGSASVVSGFSQHSYALPADVSLAGLATYAQAFLVGGGQVATNGLKIVLNF